MPDLAHSIKMEKEVFRVFRSKEAVAWGRANVKLNAKLNEIRELSAQKEMPHRDFYYVRKEEIHLHAAERDRIVFKDQDKDVTLKV